VGGAEGYAPLAVNAVFIFTADYVIFLIVTVGIVSALVNANLTTDALFRVSFNDEFRK